MRSLFAPVLLCALLAASPSWSEVVTDYGYPFADPLVATVVGTPQEYQADLPAKIPSQTRELLVLRGREVPDVFWYAATLRYTLSAQPGPARLAFIIPGTGAGFNSGKSLILQRALYQAGFHVVSLPSPLHPNFIVAASPSGRPGLLTEDAQDIYRVMALIRGYLEDEIAITGYDLVGYSLGATQAAFVAKLDDERRLARLRAGPADQPAGQPVPVRADSRPAVRGAHTVDRGLQHPVQPADAGILGVLLARRSRWCSATIWSTRSTSYGRRPTAPSRP